MLEDGWKPGKIMGELGSDFETTRHPPRGTPIRELGLTIAGTALESIVTEFEAELELAGIRRLRPRFYLSTEWGVTEGTITIAIPFYLARADLTALHAEQVGHVEGVGRSDILRYFRHEMGHVVNYAYRLYETDEWIERFGPITRAYLEDYRVEPFSRQFVRHLPGWYAQKHPDEDWSETFAVWMTPGLDWRNDYAEWPEALAKLQYCNRTMTALADRDPIETTVDLDQDVADLGFSVEQYYDDIAAANDDAPLPGIDAPLRSIFEDMASHGPANEQAPCHAASALFARLEGDLMEHVYRWTGHFPERTRPLLRHMAARADALKLVYRQDRETSAIIALTTLVATLAMNYIQRGKYLA
jgi:hypothetical protein